MLASDDEVVVVMATKATIHLLSTSYVPGAGLSASHVLTHLIFTVILSGCYYDLLSPILQMRKELGGLLVSGRAEMDLNSSLSGL